MPAFNNLSELGKYQLSQASATSALKFKLPSLKLDNKTSESPPNNLLELAKLQVKNYQEKDNLENPKKFAIPNIFSSKPANPIIDLKSALLSDVEKKELPKEPKAQKSEVFIPKFIDCDIVMERSTVPSDIEDAVVCATTLRDLINDNNVSIHQPSMMGKIIGKKSIHKNVPYVQHSYEALKIINRFKFDVPSPDDQILAHLKKK